MSKILNVILGRQKKKKLRNFPLIFHPKKVEHAFSIQFKINSIAIKWHSERKEPFANNSMFTPRLKTKTRPSHEAPKSELIFLAVTWEWNQHLSRCQNLSGIMIFTEAAPRFSKWKNKIYFWQLWRTTWKPAERLFGASPYIERLDPAL